MLKLSLTAKDQFVAVSYDNGHDADDVLLVSARLRPHHYGGGMGIDLLFEGPNSFRISRASNFFGAKKDKQTGGTKE